jgi:hypothetical protein
MAVRLGAFGTGALCASLTVSVLLLSMAGAVAQAPSLQPKPVTGFVSTFEIMRTVRAAGFDPLAPPLREGTTYVLRATDFRGIPMRVVLDARTGSIRDVTRIVSATSGPMMPPSYRASPGSGPPRAYSASPYDSPDGFGAPTGMGPGGASGQLSQPASPAATATPARPQSPPLPRQKPTEQASHKPNSGTGASVVPPTNANSATNAGTNTGVQPGTNNPATKSEATATVPPAVPGPAGKAPPLPPIND